MEGTDIADADLHPQLDSQGFLPDSALEPIPSLLLYYQQELQEHDARLRDIDKVVQVVHVAGRDVHRVKWSTNAKQVEIRDLQDALSDANIKLSRERQTLLDLLEENDKLRRQEMLDRIRIQDLLAVTQPVAQEVTFFRDSRPSKMTRYPSTAMKVFQSQQDQTPIELPGFPAAHEDKDRGVAATTNIANDRVVESGNSIHIPAVSSTTTEHIKNESLQRPSSIPHLQQHSNRRTLRTVYLPSEKPETLLFLIEALQKQIKDHKEMSEKLLTSIQRDAHERELASNNTKESLLNIVTDLEERIPRTKQLSKELMSEMLLLKHNAREDEKLVTEKNAVLRHEFDKLREQVLNVRRENRLEVQASQTVISKVRDMNLMRYRSVLAQTEQDIRILQGRLENAEEKRNIARNRELIGAMKQEYSQLEAQREAQFTNVKGKIDTLRSRVRQLEAKLLVPTSSLGDGENELVGELTPGRSFAKSQLNILRGQLSVLEDSINRGRIV